MSTPLLSTPLQFLVRSLKNSEVQKLLSKGHLYFTRIVSRLGTALSNRLIWLYLKVIIFVSTPCPRLRTVLSNRLIWLYLRVIIFVSSPCPRLRTALSNRLIWLYLRVIILCPLRYLPHKNTEMRT